MRLVLDASEKLDMAEKGVTFALKGVIVNGETKEVIAGAEYITRSIYEPNAEVVEGFTSGLMPSYKGMISDEELKLIIEDNVYRNTMLLNFAKLREILGGKGASDRTAEIIVKSINNEQLIKNDE